MSLHVNVQLYLMTPSPDKPAYGPKNPFYANISAVRPLGSGRSGKNSVHVDVELGAEGPAYTSGDSLGVFAQNAPEDVRLLLELAGVPEDEVVTLPRGEGNMSIGQALCEKLYFLARPSGGFIRTVMENTPSSTQRQRLQTVLDGPEEQLQDYIRSHHHADVLREAPSVRLKAQTLAEALPRLQPRLYSISSSPLFRPGLAQLSVAVVRYNLGGLPRRGLASTWLAERVHPGHTPLPCFVAKGPMRLPEDPARDLIMIGPGVGLAPFRAFLQEREILRATGRNWLFYGHRHEASDYYYRDEIERWQAMGTINRISLAWSRDGAQKRYVQHLLRESADQLWQWLQGGANICICGDKQHMAADVQEALCHIAADKGACANTPSEREAWLKAMKKEKRLQQDVY